jgi:hypothetical protein
MDNVMVAQAWNNTAGLALISPQPNYESGTFGKIDMAISGAVWQQAKYYKLSFTPHIQQVPWLAVLTQFGLNIDTGVYFSKVTIQFPLEQSVGHTNYNAYARLDASWTRMFPLLWAAPIYIVNMVVI